MIDLNGELSASQRVVLAIDTSEISRARELAGIAREAGAVIIKLGLELSSVKGMSWEVCSKIAADKGLDWIPDTKAGDIPNTTKNFISNLVGLDHPPVGITMHAHSGLDSLKAAQEVAKEARAVIFGVTELSSVSEDELRDSYGPVLEELGLKTIPENINFRSLLVGMYAHKIVKAGIGGLVASPKELLAPIKSNPSLSSKLTLIPGTRSEGEETHDQLNVTTPYQAIVDGADFIVIGRQITDKHDPAIAFKKVVAEIQLGLNRRS